MFSGVKVIEEGGYYIFISQKREVRKTKEFFAISSSDLSFILNFTQILHRPSFRFYIDQIAFDYRKILGRIIVKWISLDC